ncbi:hypothetical protein [Stappia sp. ICDLI1TA098]
MPHSGFIGFRGALLAFSALAFLVLSPDAQSREETCRLEKSLADKYPDELLAMQLLEQCQRRAAVVMPAARGASVPNGRSAALAPCLPREPARLRIGTIQAGNPNGFTLRDLERSLRSIKSEQGIADGDWIALMAAGIQDKNSVRLLIDEANIAPKADQLSGLNNAGIAPDNLGIVPGDAADFLKFDRQFNRPMPASPAGAAQ